MRNNTTLRNLLVLGFASLVIYAIIDGIRSGSTMGFAMGVCSLAAFIYTIHLARKLAKLKKEEEQELL
ncbi:MAG: hypothetical protein ABIS69_03145 [Sediminibacterium sp.]